MPKSGLFPGEDMAKDGHIDGALAPHSNGELSQKNPFFTTLVVDGKFSIDGVLEGFLKSEGHFILKADSPQEALSLTRRFQPDLILLDSQVEGVSGVALLPELLMEHNLAAVILLALTPSVSEAVEAMKWGAVDVLERPLDLKKLKLAVDIQKALFKVI
jgi:DNA-binding NtrC family response regulator